MVGKEYTPAENLHPCAVPYKIGKEYAQRKLASSMAAAGYDGRSMAFWSSIDTALIKSMRRVLVCRKRIRGDKAGPGVVACLVRVLRIDGNGAIVPASSRWRRMVFVGVMIFTQDWPASVTAVHHHHGQPIQTHVSVQGKTSKSG